jgi:energy-coupling factor transporter ATP-binding protein EcfA2
LFVTTNYDALLEQQLAILKKHPATAITVWDLISPENRNQTAVTVVKLKGDLSSPETLQLGRTATQISEQGKLLLRQVNEVSSNGLQLFIGFESAEDISSLSEILRQPMGTPRPRRIVIEQRLSSTRARLFRAIKVERIRMKEASLLTMVRRLRDVAPIHPYSAGTLSAAATQSIDRYRHYLSSYLRYGWTVDPGRKLDVSKVKFRARVLLRAEHFLPSQSSTETGGHLLTERGVFAAIKRARRVMITGEPGSGKTTLLRLLSFRFSSRNVAAALVPVFVAARDLDHLTDFSMDSIIDWTERSCGIGGLGDGLKSLLATGSLLFVVDGVDELRDDKVSALVQALRRYSSAFPRSRWMASCRRFGYEDLVFGESDLTLSLHPLSGREITTFLQNWFSDSTAAAHLGRVIASNSTMKALAERPLFLSLFAHLWEHSASAPLTPFKLYEAAVELLLGRWDLQRGVYRNNNYDASLKRACLSKWAVASLQRQRSSLTLSDFIEALADSSFRSLSANVIAEVVNEIESSSGLLNRVAQDEWTFCHRSFLEFFCAKAVVEAPFNDISEQIKGSNQPNDWLPILAMLASEKNETTWNEKLGAILSLFTQEQRRRVLMLADEQKKVLRPHAAVS